MADGGWIKVHRRMRQSLVWTDPNLLKLWMLILFKARHEPGKMLFNGREQLMNSGQVITGRVALRDEMNEGVRPALKVNSSFIQRSLKKFEEAQMLNIKTTTKYSVITVLNWDKYQQNEQATVSQQSAIDQLPITNKNEKNDKKYSSSSSARKDVLKFWEDNGFGVLASKTVTDLDYWVKDFQEVGASESDANALLIKAMATAVDNNARTYNYVNGILKNWESQKFKSPEEVDAHEQSRNAGRDSKNSSQAGRRSGRGTSQGKSYGGIEF